MTYVPERVLVCTPHPDDAEMGVGGTVTNWLRQGAEATLVVVTNGDKGSSDLEMTSERLVEIRECEQLAAAEVLGWKEVIFLREPDAEVEDNLRFREKLVRAIRKTRPDVVMTTDPQKRTFYQHRDHRITGQVTMDAVFPLARDHLNFPEHMAEGLQPHKTQFLYFWHSDDPDTYIDISQSIDLKIKALLKHESQIAAQRAAELSKHMKERAHEAGKAHGMEACESFRVVEMRR